MKRAGADWGNWADAGGRERRCHTNQSRNISSGGTGGSDTVLKNVRVTHIGGRSGGFVDRITVAHCDE